MKKEIAIIGGGPSGLMAADILSKIGCNVTVYERKSTFGRKFLMAGRGGLFCLTIGFKLLPCTLV